MENGNKNMTIGSLYIYYHGGVQRNHAYLYF
jgi:hypothetical protein